MKQKEQWRHEAISNYIELMTKKDSPNIDAKEIMTAMEEMWDKGFETARLKTIAIFFSGGDHYNLQRTLEPEDILNVGENEIL